MKYNTKKEMNKIVTKITFITLLKTWILVCSMSFEKLIGSWYLQCNWYTIGHNIIQPNSNTSFDQTWINNWIMNAYYLLNPLWWLWWTNFIRQNRYNFILICHIDLLISPVFVLWVRSTKMSNLDFFKMTKRGLIGVKIQIVSGRFGRFL